MNRLGKYIAELEAELAAAKDLEARTRTIHPEPEPLPSIRLASDAGRALWFMRSDLPPEKLPVMIADDEQALLAAAQRVEMTSSELEEQRRSFAYGNANIENEHVTRETIDNAAAELEGGQNLTFTMPKEPCSLMIHYKP